MYGIETDETALDPRLATSFHYDEVFGTALNRFCVQAVVGHPLTVYGEGGQTRGYLNIRDTIQCVGLAVANPADPGELRVYNQFTELFSVLELAERVRDAAAHLGREVVIERIPNPRKEAEHHYYNAQHTKLLELGLQPRYLSEELIDTMIDTIDRHRDQVNRDVILQGVKWVPDSLADRSAGTARSPVTAARVLVTGGAGFIGSALVRRLVAPAIAGTGPRRPVDRAAAPTSTGSPASSSSARLADRDAVACRGRRLRRSRPPGGARRHPRLGGRSARARSTPTSPRRSASSTRRASPGSGGSCSPAPTRSSGRTSRPPTRRCCRARPRPYGASKLAGEAYVTAYAATYGIAACALRFSNAYGPRSLHKKSVVAAWLRAALAGTPLMIHGDGEQTRDFVHVDDLAGALARGARGTRGACGRSRPAGGHRAGRRRSTSLPPRWSWRSGTP